MTLILRILMKLMISLLTTLSPRDSVSICSLTKNCLPSLVCERLVAVVAATLFVVTSRVSVVVTLVVVSNVPPPWNVATVSDSVLLTLVDDEVVSLDREISISIPTVCQEFQMTGATPDLEPSAAVVISAFSASATPLKEPSIIT